MTKCEDLIKLDAFVSSNLLQVFTLKSMMMLPEDTSSSIVAKVSSNQNLSKTLEGFSMVCRTADSKGFKIEPDKFGGFGFFNKTGRVLKPRLEPIHEIVGIIEDIPTNLREKIDTLVDNEEQLYEPRGCSSWCCQICQPFLHAEYAIFPRI